MIDSVLVRVKCLRVILYLHPHSLMFQITIVAHIKLEFGALDIVCLISLCQSIECRRTNR